MPCLRLLVLLALFGAAISPADAQRRVYAGEEAEALKCAYLISMTATLLEQRGILSTRTKDVATLVGAAILERYVSGTPQQKLAAFKAVAERRGLLSTVQQFDREYKYCSRRFPV